MALRNWFQIIFMQICGALIILGYFDEVPAIPQELLCAAANGRITLQEGETVMEVRVP
ncbi:hypothetical protein GGR53DRAFT_498011 [Hypoxylon sp. FL1150]|nr:hypothetical protein GGR53DRAFT_498011 [Hypoxylon sp. FL1150]